MGIRGTRKTGVSALCPHGALSQSVPKLFQQSNTAVKGRYLSAQEAEGMGAGRKTEQEGRRLWNSQVSPQETSRYPFLLPSPPCDGRLDSLPLRWNCLLMPATNFTLFFFPRLFDWPTHHRVLGPRHLVKDHAAVGALLFGCAACMELPGP